MRNVGCSRASGSEGNLGRRFTSPTGSRTRKGGGGDGVLIMGLGFVLPIGISHSLNLTPRGSRVMVLRRL